MRAINQAIHAESALATAVVMLLPPPYPPARASGVSYVALLRSLCAGLPLTVLCAAGTEQSVIATEM